MKNNGALSDDEEGFGKKNEVISFDPLGPSCINDLDDDDEDTDDVIAV